MKNKVASCIIETTDSQIKLEENQRKIIFENQDRRHYFKVQVDGCRSLQNDDKMSLIKTTINCVFNMDVWKKNVFLRRLYNILWFLCVTLEKQ